MAAKIVELIAPAVANGGDTIIIDVHAQNTASVTEFITATGVYDSSLITWQFDYLSVLPGETVVFRGNFIMPAMAIELNLYSWHWDGSRWINDETHKATIGVGIQGWYLAFETTRGIQRPQPGVQGWYLVSPEAVLSITRSQPGVQGWQKVAEATISIQKAVMISGWRLVAERILTITKPVGQPPPSKFPWKVAIGAGVAVAVVAAVAVSETAKKPK